MEQGSQWLDSKLHLFESKRVLELGCGSGLDTATIFEATTTLTACDLLLPQIRKKSVDYLTVDHAKQLPFKDDEFDVILASLTLHYFSWQHTQNILAELARVLIKGGKLVCRLNSDKDVNFGAKGHQEIEPGLYNVNGNHKRFFSKEDIECLFSSAWQLHDLEHHTIDRYRNPKSVWSFVAINSSHQ